MRANISAERRRRQWVGAVSFTGGVLMAPPVTAKTLENYGIDGRRPLAVAARMSSSWARPPSGASPMPLHFSDEEMDLLLELCRPIELAQRSAFLAAVAEAIGEQTSGIGLVHQVARRVQRQFWTPPELSPNATAPVHRGRAA
jgi:hypothetical protein